MDFVYLVRHNRLRESSGHLFEEVIRVGCGKMRPQIKVGDQGCELIPVGGAQGCVTALRVFGEVELASSNANRRALAIVDRWKPLARLRMSSLITNFISQYFVKTRQIHLTLIK